MPLLGKKVFNCLKSLNDIKPEETIFTISHTKEQFRSKAEFEKRKDLYDERIWTCQCTGHINLTHEEAWNSEKAVQKTLKNQFPTCFEKPVLEIVHHSTLPLDTLVDQAWLKLQQVLALKEQVSLRIKNAAASSGKGFTGTVVMIDTTGVQANPTSNCSSPSSDKENSSGEGKESSPKKWVPPKLLPYKYSIKLDEEDKIVNSIPASDLVRVDRPPSKELLRLFIRASAIRVGVTPTSPWVVGDSLVKKYSLPSKFADFLLSPAKMAEAAKRAEEESSKKRKHNSQHKPTSVKKLKKCKSSSKLSDTKKRSLSAKTKLKKKEKTKSPRKKTNSDDIVILTDDSSDDEVLANLKTSNDSDSDAPLVSLKNQLTPKKKKLLSADSDSESDTPLSKLSSSPKKKKLKSDVSPKKSKTPKTDSPRKKKSPTKSAKKLNADGMPKKRGRPRKDESSTPNSKKGRKSPSKKGMKQTTLLGIATKKGPNQSQGKTASQTQKSPRKPVLPRSVRDLAKMEPDHRLYKAKMKKAVREISPQVFSLIPDKVKDILIQKYEDRRERQLLSTMSQEQKDAYFKEKRKKQKARFEDQELKGKPLPSPKLVPTPDGIPNEYFGDITMIAEFLSTYAGLFMPEGQKPFSSEDLMKFLASGPKCFESISQVLVILLQTLLQDEIAQLYKELRTSLVDIRVNIYNASELVRLCLRKHDLPKGVDSTVEEEDSDEVSDKLIQQLETQEFYQLDAISKLKIIQGLCLRMLDSYSVQDYMESKQQEALDFCREYRQKWKQTKKDMKVDEVTNIVKLDIKDEKSGEDKTTTEEGKSGSILSHFYGKLKEGETDSGSAAGESMDDGDSSDLLNVIKSRRIKAAKTAEEKEKREKEKREIREREYREYRDMLAREKEERMCKDMVALSRRVVRHVPIGTDRNHSRYWLFNSAAPAVYVEKGWVNSDINYNCQNLAAESAPTTPKKANSITSGSQPNTPSKKKNTTDISAPHPGQNLWFVFDTPEEIEELLTALHKKGTRESTLLNALKQHQEDLIMALKNKATNSGATMEVKEEEKEEEEVEVNADEEMLNGFKKELIDIEHRIRNGGLGGIPKYDAWEARVTTATGIKELGPCLEEVQENVTDKFLKGFMKAPGYSTIVQKDEPGEAVGEHDEEVDVTGKMALGMSEWFKAIETCPTASRLHVLLGMLDSCIRWEKSADNAKCKICRKKGNDEAVLLCDECNQAFHMYCLRPALAYIPRGDWFCPACIPETNRRRSRDVKRYNDDDYDETVDPEDEDDIEHEEECAECGGDEGLVNCATCPSAYHLECHNPPLRHPPRGRWVCTECKSGRRGTRRSSRKSRQSRKVAKKKVYKESTEEEEESEEEVLPTRRKDPSSRRETSESRGRSSSRKREYVNDTIDQKPVYSRRPPSELSIIEEILEKVMKHKSAWPFLEAVDKKEVPDYHEIVKHPMDFHTMKNKLVRLSYSSPDEVIKDTALVFRNAATYNKEDSEVYKCMQEVEKAFVDTLSKKLPFYHYSREPLSNGYDDHGYSSRKRSRR